MCSKPLRNLCSVAILVLILLAARAGTTLAWSNGSYSTDPTQPKFGTHDWIAQHALEWLPAQEKQFIADNIASYLYGTELPDNANAPDGVGDTTKHHIYFDANATLKDNASAVRAQQEYNYALGAYTAGNLSATAEHLGMVAHYVSDVAVFGHVMGASTPWGAESHHSDYEEYVLTETSTYQSDYASYLAFDGFLEMTSAFNATVTVALDTTFDQGILNCTCMDEHYNWSDPAFDSRVGDSLSVATNAVADVMHTFYAENVLPNLTPSPTSTSTPTIPEIPAPFAVACLGAILVVLVIYRKTKRKRSTL